MGRWSRRKRYDCAHGRGLMARETPPCEQEAVLLSPGCPLLGKPHNCCGRHKALRIPVVMTVDPT